MSDLLETMRGFEIDHEPDGWPAVRMRQISALCDEVDRLTRNRDMWQEQCKKQAEEIQHLRADARMLDWLADPENTIGNVELPMACVTANLHSLRGAIAMAMEIKA